MYRYFFAFLIVHSIRFCYQQDINVCPLGFDYHNGDCVKSLCPETHYLVNGACLLRPTHTQVASCGFGFDLINGICVQQNCPMNHILVNGLCQPYVNRPFPPPPPPQLFCPHGFSVYNGRCLPRPGTILNPLCYPKPCNTINCPFTCDEIITTTTPITTSTTTPSTPTTVTPEPCPSDSVQIGEECRPILCSKGRPYKGRCLEPVCSHGMVWTGVSCTYPEVITTVLEIENDVITDSNQTGPDFHVSNATNHIVYLNDTTTACTTPNPNSSATCCTIMTPRMCKRYNSKWVCFNRQYKHCGEACGTYSMKYLRVPRVLEYPGMLVIPPNPRLPNCSGSECTESDVTDCSGCATNKRETCSAYCYRYRCPNKRCTFIDQSEYCTKYSGSPGCSSFDGCFENFCSSDNNPSTSGCL